jgi:signal transduction histidine kinase
MRFKITILLGIDQKSFNLDRCLRDVVNLLAHTASQKGVRVVYQYPENTPVNFVGDRARNRQVVMNLQILDHLEPQPPPIKPATAIQS